MLRTLVLAALPLALAACEQRSEEENQTAASASATDAAPSVAAEEARPITGIQLAPEGVLLLYGRDNPKVLMPFGVPRARIEKALADAGYHDPKPGKNDECPGGPLEFLEYGPFGLSIENGEFAGWALGEGEAASRYQTDKGVSLGMKKADVSRLANIIPFDESTLGDEFFMGSSSTDAGISGIFDETGRVANLWAGAVCNFR